MIEKDKWAVAERLGRKIGLDDYTYELASDAVDTLIELGWCPPGSYEGERTMIADVELVEMVARLISPYAIWERSDADWEMWAGDSRARTIARDKAKRVIEGLDLELNQLTGVIIGMRPEKKEE